MRKLAALKEKYGIEDNEMMLALEEVYSALRKEIEINGKILYVAKDFKGVFCDLSNQLHEYFPDIICETKIQSMALGYLCTLEKLKD